jgi:U3 small nucleolar RNA-associated protein 3
MSDSEDEIDAFNANQEKILLAGAGRYGREAAESELSEEEVMAEEGSDESAEEEEEDGEEEEEEEAEAEAETSGWGGRRNYYGGEESEDLRLMTAEALKQQKRHLEELAMTDYVDEDAMEGWATGASTAAHAEPAQLALGAQANLSDAEKLALLQQRLPEFVPLLRELLRLRPVLAQAQAAEGEVAAVRRTALAAYLAALLLYFALFVEQVGAGDEPGLREHAVMESVLSAKEGWRQAEALPEVAAEAVTEAAEAIEAFGAESGEASEAEAEFDEGSAESESEPEAVASAGASAAAGSSLPDITRRRHLSTRARTPLDDFSETAAPHEVDLEEKQRRKKSLRFYTSRIDAAAKTDTHGGDLDLPYRERLFERQQRLVEEARKRGMQQRDQLGVDAADDAADDADDAATARLINAMGELEYYNTVKRGKEAQKEARRTAHAVAVRAAKEGKLAEASDALGDDGKRAVNFQILKNKGLTPHRSKDNRNSRVKKRKKYEQAKKKLRSVRQVYEEHRGPYEGEKTGIKKGITRSVKLH